MVIFTAQVVWMCSKQDVLLTLRASDARGVLCWSNILLDIDTHFHFGCDFKCFFSPLFGEDSHLD